MTRPPSVVAAALLVVALAARAVADTGTSLGDRTGEGSTPFTGLAQAPEANLFTGTMQTSVPIDVPPGRKGMTPQLALVYSSAGGPSPYGYGWDLPIGRIERTTKWGVPECGSPHFDEFVVTLPGLTAELVADPVANNYRPRVEESYLAADLAGDVWTMLDRSGRRFTFGGTPSARLGQTGGCPFTSVWYLTRVQDSNGNVMDVTYTTYDGVPYPSQVAWGGNVETGLANFYFVTFTWEVRPDPTDRPVSYRHGVREVLSRRLASLFVFTSASSPGSIREYTFDYDAGAAEGPGSMLHGVNVPGYPPQTFVYTSGVNRHTVRTWTPPAGVSRLRSSDDSGEVFDTVLDMDGDGRLDLVHAASSGSWTVRRGCSPGAANPSGCATTYGFSATVVTWNAVVDHPSGGGSFAVPVIRDTLKDCPGPPETCARWDTLDLTGDGIPDWVWADDQTPPIVWKVYPGEMSGGTRRFRPTPIAWPAPVPFVRTDGDGGVVHQDVRDMTGDGLPDLVTSGGPTWSVYRNLGDRFEASPILYSAPFPDLEITHPQNENAHVLLDFNGDALPDVVKRSNGGADPNCGTGAFGPSCLYVYFNIGRHFEATPRAVATQFGGWLPTNGKAATKDLIDVNGDGLPDLVDLRPIYGSVPRVALNTGGDFERPVMVDGPVGPMAHAPRTWPSLPFGEEIRGERGEFVDMLDVDGDGLADRVAAGAGSWTIHLSTNDNQTLPRAKLLLLMQNGLGGKTTVRYRPSTDFDNNVNATGLADLPFVTWVVTGIRQTDGLCEPLPSTRDFFDRIENRCIEAVEHVQGRVVKVGHEHVTTISYREGSFDGPTREFRGFRFVTQSDVDGNPVQIEFHQDAARKGRPKQIGTYAGWNFAWLVRQEDNVWSTAPFPGSPGRTQLWLASNTVTTRDQASATPHVLTRANDRPDAYGNFLHSTRRGSHVDTLHTYSEYAVDFSPVLDRPKHTRRTNGAGTTLQEEWFYYDGQALGGVTKGNVTRHEAWHPNGTVATRMAYDAYGNVVSVTDAKGAVTTTTYDAHHLYAVQVRNPLGHTTTTTTDYRWGKPTQVTDPNGAVTAYTYDATGRIAEIRKPYESLYSERYVYHFGGDGLLSDVLVFRREPAAPGGFTRVYAYYDALGRSRGSAVERQLFGSTTLATVRLDDTEYGPAGRPAVRYDPYDESAGHRDNGATTFDYHLNGGEHVDPLGRVWKTTQPDTAYTVVRYFGDRREEYDELGTKTVVTVDADGNVVTRQVYDGATLHSTVTHEYDALGRLLTTRQNGSAAATITTTWDPFDRRTSLVDPDSGSWTYQYDAVGNLVFQNDPRAGHGIQLCWDAARRLTKRFFLTGDAPTKDCVADAGDERYTYDETTFVGRDGGTVPNAGGTGRLTKVVDPTGQTTFRYDLRGRVVESLKTVTVGGVARTAAMSFAYDLADRITQTTYPDGHAVATTYNQSGQPTRLGLYVAQVDYDVFGRITRMVRGNGTVDRLTYYDLQGDVAVNYNHRLKRIRTTGPGGVVLLNLHYAAYNPRLQLTRVQDCRDPSGPLSNEATYAYDFAGRLVQVSGTQNGTGTTDFAWDAFGNLVRKGDRVFCYAAAKPHQLVKTKIWTGNPGVCGDDGAFPPVASVSYDANGNRTGKTAQTYQYDHDDRVKQIVASGHTLTFGYDYAGARVWKRDAAGSSVTTRYFSKYFEVSGTKQIRHYFLGDLHVASAETTVPSGAPYAAVHGADGPVFAEVGGARPVLHVLLGPAARLGFLASVALVLVAVVALPAHRRRLGRVSVRVGPTLGLVAAVALGTTAWTVVLAPAPAEAACNPGEPVLHRHYDHLGSTQVLTTATGTIAMQVRYGPWGEVLGRWDASGNPVGSVPAQNRFEFTGYETEIRSGLAYAGARWYDPDLASFQTHDPQRQFKSPYAYGGGDPLNGTDPNGEFFWVIVAAFVVGALASGINAAINGATLGQALKAAAIGGLVSGASAFVGGAIVGPALQSVGGAIGAQLVRAGVVSSGTLSQLATVGEAIISTALLAKSGWDAAQGDYTGLIAFGLTAGYIGIRIVAARTTPAVDAGVEKLSRLDELRKDAARLPLEGPPRPLHLAPVPAGHEPWPVDSELPLFRVFDGERAHVTGRFWTPENPAEIPLERLGLYNNQAKFVAEARLLAGSVSKGLAAPNLTPGSGGALEIFVPDPSTQLKIVRVDEFKPLK